MGEFFGKIREFTKTNGKNFIFFKFLYQLEEFSADYSFKCFPSAFYQYFFNAQQFFSYCFSFKIFRFFRAPESSC
ncbi:hypothetical protein, partial [Oenococcus oeni]